jgi:hypothetical protein
MNKSGTFLLVIVLLANSFQFGASAQADKVAAEGANMVSADLMSNGTDGDFNHHPAASKLLVAKISGIRAKVSEIRENMNSTHGGDMMDIPKL